jgi:dolichyl-phosphate-mannose-protein mannosyltransferase
MSSRQDSTAGGVGPVDSWTTPARGKRPTARQPEGAVWGDESATAKADVHVSTARPEPAPEWASPGTGRAGSRRRRRQRSPGARLAAAWPLLAVLVVQAALSLRLVRADTAFQDEATYLWAGHLQWAHWLHGTPLPPFPTYFSGAPVVYPPVGALADSVGGLAAARALSLVFMLAATVLVWATAGRLYGRLAAFFAAALFAVSGPTLHLGSFATYDALSVMLLALAAWCAVRAGVKGEGTGWTVAAGAALAVANAAAYSSALFDLVVLAIAALIAWPAGARLAARRCATILIVLAVLIAAGLLAGGSSYLTGIKQTTLARAGGANSPLSVLADAWSWTGLLVVLAVLGVIISLASREGAVRTWLLAVLAVAGMLGPLEQAHLHTLASLNKHVGLGAWFAAIAAGYAVGKVIGTAPAGRMRTLTLSACVLALVFPLSLGAAQSWTFSTDWPNASSFIAIFRPLADHGNDRLLVEDGSIARYYLPSGSQWQRWSTTRNIVLASDASTGGPSSTAGVTGAGNAGVFAEFITRGYFSLVALNFADTTTLDRQIAADLRRSHHYHIIDVIPYGIEVPPIGQGTYVIWRYEPRP